MHSAKLRQVGGSVMVAVPKSILESFALKAGSDVSVEVEEGRIVMCPRNQPRYTLRELLEQCDGALPVDQPDAEWLTSPSTGQELI